MSIITAYTPLLKIAALVSELLVDAGIPAVLSGGGADLYAGTLAGKHTSETQCDQRRPAAMRAFLRDVRDDIRRVEDQH